MFNELDVINWLLDNDMIYRGRTRLPISSGLNSIKHTLQRNKMVLDALKNYLHIIPMNNENDVIGIGCPSNEDVIEPNDYGYDIIKEWLKDDNDTIKLNCKWADELDYYQTILSIIKEKNVHLDYLNKCSSAKQYNKAALLDEELSDEEFNLLKEFAKK